MKSIKLLLLPLFLMVITGVSYAQGSPELSIRVLQPERDNLTHTSCRFLETKMTQLLTRNGVVYDMPFNRFVITAKANVLSKDIIAGSPSRISEKLELTFIIGDAIENIWYGSHVLPLTGVGLNEEQALQNAIKSIKVNDPDLNAFVQQSKTRIVDYYLSNASSIMQEADALVSEERYDEALYRLALIPSECGDVFESAQNKMQVINKRRIDLKSESLLSQAKAEWAKNPNATGAEAVFSLVSTINPRAHCFPNVASFLDEVRCKLTADEEREWAFQMKQYEDNIAREKREFEARQKKEATRAELRRKEIDAARQVAIEYARNQPDVVYNTVLIW